MKFNSTLKLALFRFLAFIVDTVIICVIALLLSLFGVPFFQQATINVFGLEINSYVTRIGPVVSWLYHAIFECSVMQATLGKYFFDLSVSNILFHKANFAQTTVRHFSKILSILLIGGGYIMFFFNVNRQCLHDYFSATVIHLKKVEESES